MTHVVLPGTAGNNVSTPHRAGFDISTAQSLLIIAYVAANDWSPASSQSFCSIYGANAAAGMFRCTVVSPGILQMSVSVGGVGGSGATTTVLQTASGIADGQGIWVWYMWRSTTGTVDFKYSTNPPETSLASIAWTNLQLARSGAPTGIPTTVTAPLQIGGYDTGGGLFPFSGKVYRCAVFSGPAGGLTSLTGATEIADMNPAAWVKGKTFTSGLANDVWTINGTAQLVGGGSVLNVADKVAIGNTSVDAMYAGSNQVWAYPKSIPNLMIWLDTRQIAGMVDGTPMSSWPDVSGNGFTVTTTAGVATYRTNAGINGRPSVRFGKSALAEMQINHGRAVSDRTVFQVVQTAGSSNGPYHTTQLQELSPYLQTYGTPTGTINTYTNPAPLISGVVWSGAPQLITVWCNTATATQGLDVNGTQVTSAWTPEATSSKWYIGGFTPAGYGLNGFIGEIIIYDRCLTDTERASMLSYLHTKWNF